MKKVSACQVDGDIYIRTKKKNGKTYAIARYVWMDNKWGLIERINPPQLIGGEK